MDNSKKLTILETVCALFWLLFDGFWLLEWPQGTYVCSLIAFVLALIIFFYLESGFVPFLIALVDTFWLLMNVFWIINDFEHSAWAREIAKICFWSSIFVFTLAFIIGSPGRKTIKLLLRRFRAFRMFYAQQ